MPPSKTWANKSYPNDGVVEVLVNKAVAQAGNGDSSSFWTNASFMEKGVVVGLAALTLGSFPAVAGTLGTIATALTLGPVIEGITLETLGSAATAELGAYLGGGALAAKLGLFRGVQETLNGGESVMQAATKHPLAGLSPENVVRLIGEVGLETPRDQLLLWSGLGRGEEGARLAMVYARTNGGMTLEMTKGGSWLNEMDLFGSNSPFTFKEAVKIWEGVSTKMTQQASGQVSSLIGQVRPTSIYRAEQSEILMNTKITGLDELYLKPRFTFGRN